MNFYLFPLPPPTASQVVSTVKKIFGAWPKFILSALNGFPKTYGALNGFPKTYGALNGFPKHMVIQKRKQAGAELCQVQHSLG